MNETRLQDALVSDLERLFRNRRYKTAGGELAAVSVFAQNLPKRESEDDDDPFPYIIVRLDSGTVENQVSPSKAAVLLLVGMYDDDRKNQGHRAVLEVLEEVRRHYEEVPLLDGAFVFSDPYRWTLQEEESYPYFFGGAELSFDLPAPRRKWSEFV